MGLILNRLDTDAIDEKIYLNQKANISLDLLIQETKKDLSEFTWEAIRCNVQIQFLKEQIEHFEKRKKQIEGKDNPYIDDKYKENLSSYS